MVTLTRDDPDYEPGIPLAAFLLKKRAIPWNKAYFRSIVPYLSPFLSAKIQKI
jgi:hypothetical protein